MCINMSTDTHVVWLHHVTHVEFSNMHMKGFPMMCEMLILRYTCKCIFPVLLVCHYLYKKQSKQCYVVYILYVYIIALLTPCVSDFM